MYVCVCVYKSPAVGDNLFPQAADHKILIPYKITMILLQSPLPPKISLILFSNFIHFDNIEYIMNNILFLITP